MNYNKTRMKKFTILTIAIFASLAVCAQFNRGRMLVGGSAEFSTAADKSKTGGTTVKNGNYTSLTVSPQFGYFVIDNLAVGAALSMGLGKWNAKNDNDDDMTSTSIQFQPFVRYYLPMGIFFQGKVGLGTTKYKYDNSNFDDKYNTTSLALSGGYALFLADNVAVEPEVGYRITKSKEDDSDVKEIDSGLFIRIGFQIYLGNKE